MSEALERVAFMTMDETHRLADLLRKLHAERGGAIESAGAVLAFLEPMIARYRRAAILAFLDTEGMAEKIRDAIAGTLHTDEEARRALSALRAEAGGKA